MDTEGVWGLWQGKVKGVVGGGGDKGGGKVV